MKSFRIIALCLLIVSVTCGFYQSRDSNYNKIIGGGGSSYTGPGDVVSGASYWYGLRGYNAAYSTGSNNAITIRRASDNTTSNIKILSTGALDVATATTFCASTTCFLAGTFDQSGANSCSGAPCNLTAASNAAQPQILFSGCLNSAPVCINWLTASDQGLSLTTNVPSIASPYTMQGVVSATSTSGYGAAFYTDPNTNYNGMGWNGNVAGAMEASNNSTQISAPSFTANTVYAMTAVFNGASSLNALNITTSSGTQDTSAAANQIWLGTDSFNGDGLNGEMFEMGLWPSALNTTQITNLCHNQRLAWGFAGGSC